MKRILIGVAALAATLATSGAHAVTLEQSTNWGSSVNYYNPATNAYFFVGPASSYERKDLTTGTVLQRYDSGCAAFSDGVNSDYACGAIVTNSDPLALQGTITGTLTAYSGATLTINLTYLSTHVPGSAPLVDVDAAPSATSPEANVQLGSSRIGRVGGTVTHSTIGTLTFDFNAGGNIYSYSTLHAAL